MPATSFSNLITFSRGTNATVTDSTGRLTYAPNNLFTLSEQFDNAAWSKFATTVTANATTAPDGTTTADRILETTFSGTHLVAANAMVSVVTGQSYTISVYVKPSGRNWFRITSNFSGGSFASFDIANGVLGTVSGGTASITDAGNGWWRCSLTVVATSTGTASPDFRLATSNATISYAGNASLGVFLWGAQMEAVTYQTTPSTYYPTTVKNLLGYSEAFDNAAWTKTDASITNCPYVNPVNGLFTAQKLMENTANAVHVISQGQTLAAAPYVFSIYARAAERSWVQLRNASGTNQLAFFDLANGVVGTVGANATATIQSVGNGWYRCAITFTAAAGSNFMHVRTANADNVNTYTGDGNSGIYIYGAQLSDSASLDPYVPTPAAAPSSTAYYGPRFDYDPVTLAPKGLLVEEARTNLLTYSEQFDNAAWTQTSLVVTANATTAPDGTTNADKLVEDSANNFHVVNQVFTVSNTTAYSFSVFVKKSERTLVNLRLGGQTGNPYVIVDLDTGLKVAGSLTPTISLFANGFYRIEVSLTTNSTTLSVNVGSAIDTTVDGFNRSVYQGNGTSGIFIYGAQLEAGAFATSYIPTVASTVTRSADVATITGSLFSGWYNQAQGTFLVQAVTFKPTTLVAVSEVTSANDGTTNNRITTRFASNTSDGVVVASGSTVAAISTSYTAGATTKLALAAAANDFAFAVNGGLIGTDTAGAVPTVTQLNIGNLTGFNYLNGHIRSIQYIPNATSATQLQSLSAS